MQPQLNLLPFLDRKSLIKKRKNIALIFKRFFPPRLVNMCKVPALLTDSRYFDMISVTQDQHGSSSHGYSKTGIFSLHLLYSYGEDMPASPQLKFTNLKSTRVSLTT